MCHKIYYTSQCKSYVGTQTLSKKCSHVRFINHPHSSRRKECGCLLLKTVQTKLTKKLLPFKVYCYNSLIESVKNLYNTKEFVSNCELWRKDIATLHRSSEFIHDVYSGKMWQEFSEGMLLKEPFSLAFILNVDWFQPFTHTKYSVGVIYLTVLNLPRHIRYVYKRENVILIGIIPGPHEPKMT